MTTNLTIDAERLWDTLLETATFGGTAKGGVRRLALSEEDRRVRAWFREQAEAAGLVVGTDELGTQFALRAGRDPTIAPIAFGSHLDTQPTGGKFDGVLGVLAGLEVMRTLQAAGYETTAPLLLVNWPTEEGARFPPAMMAYGVYGGELDRDAVLATVDADGGPVAEALAAIGEAGDEPVGARVFSAFVELHIEQGPILEAEGVTIGVVTHGQGMSWFDGRVTGRESHAGTTPMPLRKDALAAFAELVLAVEQIARGHAPAAVGTIGVATVGPGSRNTIPGEVAFTVEFRHPERAVLDRMEAEFRAMCTGVGRQRGVTVALDRIWTKDPVAFHPAIVDAVERAAGELGHRHRRIISGAGHDACNVAAGTPTGMIFVPCKEGISHNEEEDATKADCAAGADVLLRTVLAIDAAIAREAAEETQASG